MMAADIRLDAFTISGGRMFGKTWRPRIRWVGAPSVRAASTNSRSRTASVEPRASRAKPGVETIAMAMMALVRLVPRMVLMTSARTSAGKAKRASMTRISDLVESTTLVAGELTQDGPGYRREHDGQHADRQRDLRAVEDPAQDVPSELVGAKQVIGRGRQQRIQKRLAGRVVRRQHRRQDGAHHDEQRTENADATGRLVEHLAIDACSWSGTD